MRQEGRGGGDVLRHLRLLPAHQEGLQAGAVLLRSRRVEQAEVHLDTECIVENISQSDGEKLIRSTSVVAESVISPDHI